MGTIRVQNVFKQFGDQSVLADLSVDLVDGEVVGLVGSNGSGKTTLLRILAGDLVPDRGTVTRSKGMEVGYLAQEPAVCPGRTLHEEVGSAFEALLEIERRMHVLSDEIAAKHDGPELGALMERYDRLGARFEAAGGYAFVQRLNEVLGGLGFSEADHSLPMSALSGGQKCRAALAKLLLRDRSFLLMDEPTNHLDIDAVRWLEKFMAGHHGGAVIVSHDRYLLDRLVDRIVEVDRGGVALYPGNYSNYVKSKALRLLTLARRYEKDRAYIEKERAFIAKHLSGQRTKEAQGRRTRLERGIREGAFVLERPAGEKSTKLRFGDVRPGVGTALRVDELCKRYGEKRLFEALSFQVQDGERFGITGPNGVGKTTLLRILVGEEVGDDGTYVWGPAASVGYYAQEAVDLDPATTLVDQVRAERPGMSEHEARNYLAGFRFTGEGVFKRVGLLSGGEQSRLRLAKLMLRGSNVLVLDEPTNHLDIASREVLEAALLEFPGTIVVVSHDRYFLDRMVNRLLVLRPDGQRVYGGNYSFYVGETERAETAAAVGGGRGGAGKKKRGGRGGRGRAGGDRSEVAVFDGYSVEALEAYIVEREERVAALHDRFADTAVYRDAGALAALRAELEAVQAELAAAERAWGERGDEGS